MANFNLHRRTPNKESHPLTEAFRTEFVYLIITYISTNLGGRKI